MGIASDWLFNVARTLVLRKQANAQTGVANDSIDGRKTYASWRERELYSQFVDHFDVGLLTGSRVLDFGCGTGFLCGLAARQGAADVIGLDLCEDDINTARERFANPDDPASPRFLVADSQSHIPFPNATFDVILCFDVLEHIFQYQEILSEWARVLKPGGRILIWWQPYYHPWGHHLIRRIPIPWAHVFFSNHTLAEVWVRIYNMEEYRPSYNELDENGQKRVHHQPDPSHLGGLNMLTIGAYERAFAAAGLRISRRELHPFRGQRFVAGLSALLSRLPGLNEYFTAFLVYELTTPRDNLKQVD